MDVKNFTQTEDDYMPWALAAFILFAGALLLRSTLLRFIP